MPLVVPILRFVMLFLNVYDSYKTLKPPPVSRRNAGEPSQRALVQRKRDMKGCLAVWIVWSCFVVYERMAEVVVSLFVPFYDEFKSIALLFLIFTRARGAEPIFLHVLRPLLKPYTSTLDLLLDFFCMVGDMTFAVVKIPIKYALIWWNGPLFHVDEATKSKEPSLIQALAAHEQASLSQLPQVTKSGLPTNGANGVSRSYQVWYPPSSAYPGYGHTTRRGIDGLPAVTVTEEVRRENEEWRKYPAFPSAYPPTPLAIPISRLPSSTGPASPRTLSGIPEDYPQPDFRRFRQPQIHDSNISHGHKTQSADAEDVSMGSVTEDDEDEYSEDEDDFHVSLKTPRHLANVIQIDRQASIRSGSTVLSTDHPSTLRTQSSSESLSSASESHAPTKKRPPPRESPTRNQRASLQTNGGSRSKGSFKNNSSSSTARVAFQKGGSREEETGTSSTDRGSDQKSASPKRKRMVVSPTRAARTRFLRPGSGLGRAQNNRAQPRLKSSKESNGRNTDDNGSDTTDARTARLRQTTGVPVATKLRPRIRETDMHS